MSMEDNNWEAIFRAENQWFSAEQRGPSLDRHFSEGSHVHNFGVSQTKFLGPNVKLMTIRSISRGPFDPPVQYLMGHIDFSEAHESTKYSD